VRGVRQNSRARDHRVSGEEDAPEEATAPLVTLESTEAHLIAPLTIVFVRHGVTDMTVTRNFSGGQVEGPSLNAEGRVQAA